MKLPLTTVSYVSDACQINDLDHIAALDSFTIDVSDACQINDLDHAAIFV